MTFLAPYYDAELEVDTSLLKRDLEKVERERLTIDLHVAVEAGQIPRRLGGDATDIDLAQDKRRAKRVSFALKQCLTAWGGPTKHDAKDIKQRAAQMDWTHWWEIERVYLNNRIRYLATWQVKASGDIHWTKRAVTRLQNELRWVEYALRA